MTTFILAFSLGLLGSMHCIGMCGGLVSALSLSNRKTWWPGLVAYQAGRILTYSLIGLASGIIGMSLRQISGFGQMQNALTVVAGIVMVAFGLNFSGWLPDPLRRLGARVMARLKLAVWIVKAAASRRYSSWFGVGLVNGLLPCGLVYAALSLSLASGAVLQAVSFMAVFGLGTVPAMMLVPYVTHRLTPQARGLAIKMLGVLVIIIGLITIGRGNNWMLGLHGDSHSNHASHPSLISHPGLIKETII